jgi:hypothetical protein
MRFFVHFSTIQPRFKHLDDTINSLKCQNVPVEKIMITTSIKDNRFKSLEELHRYKDDIVNFQIIEVDYGPHNKILGALKFYETLDNKHDVYMMICDDDNKYDVNTINSYKESLETNKDYIYTHFFEQNKRLKYINHLQGADSYLLTPKFFEKTSYDKYIAFLNDIIWNCHDALYQDDYVISFYLYTYCEMQIKTVSTRHRYKSGIQIEQLHRDPNVHRREKNTKDYLSKLIV